MERTVPAVEAISVKSEYLMNALGELGEWLMKAGLRLLVAVLLVFIGLKLIKKVRKGMGRSMERAGMEITLRKFLDALLYAVLLGLLVFVAAEEMGIQSTSLVAVVGSVTLATSLAMQNTLANFAGGVLILFFKPFKVGDYISSANGEGTVETIGLVYTILYTVENKMIVIPNNSLANSALVNTSSMETKRLVLTVGISYGSDLSHAKEVLRDILERHPAVRNEDGILVVVDSLGESSVNLSARGWTSTEDYWQARWDILEEIKLRFDREGIEIPYNQLRVHVNGKQ